MNGLELRLALAKVLIRVVHLPSPEGGKIYSFIMFSTYLQFQKMNKVHKAYDSAVYSTS
jgi:hypothetical protein